ncbi:peptidase family M48-domain-containing protein [Crepidotus variabilis]|uniref:Peptidase family M48-domain-containing protein n=1 Tax=Crepidotus variabilis TaxID=179855 RepID=A0A9P6JLB0_9AGAR|nr:peptidase family M48-domain-containing protein [Crepidotus variabilis]
MFRALRSFPRSSTLVASVFRAGTRHTACLPRRFSTSTWGSGTKEQQNSSQGWIRRPITRIRRQLGAVIAVGGLIYYVAHLEQVPDTGRWRFMNTSTTEEAKVGQDYRRQVRDELEDLILPPDHPTTRHVHAVASRILRASNLGRIRGEHKPEEPSSVGLFKDSQGNSRNPDADVGAAEDPGLSYGPQKEWDVIVVNDRKTVNAYASPGLIVIYTGILPVCHDEAGLAAVIGHEIGHIVARHTAERLSTSSLFLGFTAVLALVGLDLGISYLLTTYALDLPNSRKQECEADVLGLRLISRACYDPIAMSQMLGRLAKAEANQEAHVNLDFLHTHPSSESRARLMEKRLHQGQAIFDRNPDCLKIKEQLEEFKKAPKKLRLSERGLVYE